MPDYIPIADIPPHGGVWPYEEWKKIPPYMAMELTEKNGKTIKNAVSSIRTAFRRHPEWNLTIFLRKEKAYIAKGE